MHKGKQLPMLVLIIGVAIIWTISGCVTMEKKEPQPSPVQQQVETPPPKPTPPPPPPVEVEKPQPSQQQKVETSPPPPPEPDYIEHVVRWQGETLSLISKWYTGKFSNWKAIVEANPGLNPKRMRKGTIIKIPRELVRTQTPMPKSFIDKFYKKKDEEPVLFGPKR